MLYILEFIILFLLIWTIWDTLYKYVNMPCDYVQKNNFKTYNNLLYYIFDLIPKRLAEWLHARNNRNFDEYGLILYCGSQGEGKTYSMIHQATLIQATYPDCKVYGNLWAIINDYQIEDWKQLIFADNGKLGLVFLFDEISLWWNSRFRDLNPLVLQELVQNRKNKRVIFGTCQNISMVDKQIRLQATEYRNCHCFLGAFIICTCWRPVFDMSSGELIDKKFLGLKTYIQDDAIRYSYDTFQTIKALAESGFNYDISKDNNNITYYGGNDEKRRKKRIS